MISIQHSSSFVLLLLVVLILSSANVEARRGPHSSINNNNRRASSSGKWGTGQAPFLDLSPAAQEDLAKDLMEAKKVKAVKNNKPVRKTRLVQSAGMGPMPSPVLFSFMEQ